MRSADMRPDVLRRLSRRLHSASDAEWAEIASAMAPMQGDTAVALWRRAQHRALWGISVWPRAAPVFNVFFAAGELLREFRPIAPTELIARAKRRQYSALEPEYRAALMELWELAVRQLPGDPTSAEAVVMAGALASRSTLNEGTLLRAWAPLERVVPLDAFRNDRSPSP